MINKRHLLASLAILPLATTLHAGSPLLKLSDDGSANLFFVADATAKYSDNIFYRHNKIDDGIYTIAPGINLVAGGDGSSKFDLKVQESLTAYWNHSNLNSQLTHVNAAYAYDAGSAFKATLAAGFNQNAQPTNQTAIAGDIVQNDAYNGNANAEYAATEKSKITAGVNYNGTRYTNYQNRFNDQDSYNIPVSWLYNVTEKLFVGFTYSYGYTQIYSANAAQRDGDQEVHFGGIRATGSITEKLTLEARAGVGYSDLKSIIPGFANEQNTTFNFDLSATYQITEKLCSTLSGGRNFSVAAQGQQLTSTNGNISFDYKIDEQWGAGVNSGYMNQEFAGFGSGTDRIFTSGASVNYTPDKYWKLSLAYTYMNDDTTRPGADDFDANLISLSASFRY